MKTFRSWLLPLLCTLSAVPALAEGPSRAPFLWEVDGPKAKHYLLGSVHLLPADAEQLPDGLEQAYLRSAELVFESDIAALSSPDLQSKLLAAAKADKPLKASVAPALYERLVRRAGSVGMPMAMCEPFRAWFCALSLELFSYQHAGFRAELGIDQQFYKRAVTDEKPVHWLEEPQAHLALFTDTSAAQSEQILAATVDELIEAGSEPADLLRTWREGNGAALEELGAQLKARTPAIYERLLAGRNRAWLQRLQGALDGDKPQLIIVGAAHLYGPDGLVALLRQKGYRIQAADRPAEIPEAPPPQARLKLR
ncbi:TraB/GumN family protein [Solimonas sp. K1W22B-7]|uniref:TraB/GumN family protein n=1 Tax=Solimonas sp. K1W22B-7 TaxID=2303331 RepID=UPI000E334FE9|nr:TraB/GumN family protein [Solimonas sp. K1W22B-7]AXQ31428.1 TraB/GumN family protein [Solimonas sp. K1W22B-7]